MEDTADQHRELSKWQMFLNICRWALYYSVGVIAPDGYFRAMWDLVIAVFLAYISITLPYNIAFNYDDGNWSPSCPDNWPWKPEFPTVPSIESAFALSPVELVQYSIDLVFACDIMCVLLAPCCKFCFKLMQQLLKDQAISVQNQLQNSFLR